MKRFTNKYIERTAAVTVTCTLVLLAAASGCSSSSSPAAPPPSTTPTTVTVSGKINSTANPAPGAGEPGVTMTAIYSDTDPANPTTITSADGTYSVTVDTSKSFSLQMSKTDFTTFNFQRVTLTSNISDGDEDIITTDEAQTVINLALAPAAVPLADKAWVVVNITDASDNQVGGLGISTTPTPTVEIYTDCNGADSTGSATIGPCVDRPVMYLAYYDTAPASEVSVTAIGETQVVPARQGQVSVLDFEQ